ncbi:MAG: hypothetical protein KAR35_08525, partial [Candidatus Heimdallarchaeota archaeon]|nr:hypothetical protein [Candidatus Heimdallarchaeota archaeon]MCK5049402.1 hypothetical protein [Candidatus Heimdallarchaeota archaeon]
MEHFQEIRVTVIREVILDYLKDMRDQRLLHEDQLRAKAEELRASSLTPGVSQYPASEIAEISNRFKDGLIHFLRTVYLKIETESGSKIREGIETGLAQGNVIEAEFLEELRRLQTQSPVESSLSEARVAQYQASLVEQSETVSDLS